MEKLEYVMALSFLRAKPSSVHYLTFISINNVRFLAPFSLQPTNFFAMYRDHFRPDLLILLRFPCERAASRGFFGTSVQVSIINTKINSV